MQDHMVDFLRCRATLIKESPFRSLVSYSVHYSKKPTAKIMNFGLGKKGEEKTGMSKVTKSSHQVTFVQSW